MIHACGIRLREIQISYPYVIEPVGDVVVAYAARFSSVKISFFENVLTKYFILIQRRAKKKNYARLDSRSSWPDFFKESGGAMAPTVKILY